MIPRKHLAQIVKSTEATLRARKGDAAKAREEGRKKLGMARDPVTGLPEAYYTPPRSTSVDAAKEAEATFAPAEPLPDALPDEALVGGDGPEFPGSDYD